MEIEQPRLHYTRVSAHRRSCSPLSIHVRFWRPAMVFECAFASRTRFYACYCLPQASAISPERTSRVECRLLCRSTTSLNARGGAPPASTLVEYPRASPGKVPLGQRRGPKPPTRSTCVAVENLHSLFIDSQKGRPISSTDPFSFRDLRGCGGWI